MPKTTANGPSNAAADAEEATRRMSMAEYLAPAQPDEAPTAEDEGGEQPSDPGISSSASSGKPASRRTGSGAASRRRAPMTGNP